MAIINEGGRIISPTDYVARATTHAGNAYTRTPPNADDVVRMDNAYRSTDVDTSEVPTSIINPPPPKRQLETEEPGWTPPSAPWVGNVNTPMEAIDIPGYYIMTPEAQQAALLGTSFVFAQTEEPADEPEPPGYQIEDINQVDLAVFFSQYENSKHIEGTDFAERYLTNPELMEYQTNLISELVNRVQEGEAPLTLEEFYELALEETGDPGTALMVAHNITKSLSRGFSPIPWAKESAEPLLYTLDGETIEFDPSQFHPDAASSANGEPSVFYAMFSQEAIGTTDPGDSYHFYLTAATAYYGASGELRFNDDSAINPADYSRAVDNAIDGAMDQMKDAPDSDAYARWRFANSLSYLEGAKYGQDYNGGQDSVNRESNIHREGTLFGLTEAGVEPDPSWKWYVPKVGAASGQYDTSVNLSEDAFTILDAQGGVMVAEDEVTDVGGGNSGSSR